MLRTSDLEPHERLLVWRRRADMTQAQAATYFDMTPWTYRMAEKGEGVAPKVNLGKLELHEAAVVIRRRNGMTRNRLSKELGLSPWWITLMERGQQDPERLIEFWSQVK